MKTRSNRLWLILLPLVLVLGYAIWDSFSQPNIKSLEGDFEEVAFVRNDQNKGGIIRIYAVSVGDIAHADYKACAELFPVNDFNSTTRVYFFDKNKDYPKELSIDAPYYDTTKYQAINIVKRTGTN